MSQEITREQNVMLLLGNMRAEQRFAAFLVNLSARYAARGYSASTFQLRMSREEIGNYLGLTIESISRLLSRFKKQNLLRVSNREIEMLAPEDLKAMCFEADIIVSCVGIARMIKADFVKPGATVVDVGVTRVDGKIVGDVDFDAVQAVAGAITPMPGGTGPMTIGCLLENTLSAAKMLGAFPR